MSWCRGRGEIVGVPLPRRRRSAPVVLVSPRFVRQGRIHRVGGCSRNPTTSLPTTHLPSEGPTRLVRCSAGCSWVRLVELRASVAGGRGRGRGVAAAGVRRANCDVAFVEGGRRRMVPVRRRRDQTRRAGRRLGTAGTGRSGRPAGARGGEAFAGLVWGGLEPSWGAEVGGEQVVGDDPAAFAGRGGGGARAEEGVALAQFAWRLRRVRRAARAGHSSPAVSSSGVSRAGCSSVAGGPSIPRGPAGQQARRTAWWGTRLPSPVTSRAAVCWRHRCRRSPNTGSRARSGRRETPRGVRQP